MDFSYQVTLCLSCHVIISQSLLCLDARVMPPHDDDDDSIKLAKLIYRIERDLSDHQVVDRFIKN